MVLFKGALFWVEVEVVLAKPIKDLSDQDAMAGNMFIFRLSLFAPSVSCYIIHVDRDAFSVDEVSEYDVHHGLEGGRGVGQTKEHDCGFK